MLVLGGDLTNFGRPAGDGIAAECAGATANSHRRGAGQSRLRKRPRLRADEDDDRGRDQGARRYRLRARRRGLRRHQRLSGRLWTRRADRLRRAGSQGIRAGCHRRSAEAGACLVATTHTEARRRAALRPHRRHRERRAARDLSVSRQLAPGGGHRPSRCRSGAARARALRQPRRRTTAGTPVYNVAMAINQARDGGAVYRIFEV